MPKGGNGNGNGKGGGGGGHTHPKDILAVAFTDLNGDHKFQANKDALIAAVIDTNHDKTVSVGDTVTFGTFPHLDGTQAGTFTHADSTITFVTVADSTHIEVRVPDGFVFLTANPKFESFTTEYNAGVLETEFIDNINNDTYPQFDEVYASNHQDFYGHGPGDQDVTGLIIETNYDRPGNDGFLDVLIA